MGVDLTMDVVVHDGNAGPSNPIEQPDPKSLEHDLLSHLNRVFLGAVGGGGVYSGDSPLLSEHDLREIQDGYAVTYRVAIRLFAHGSLLKELGYSETDVLAEVARFFADSWPVRLYDLDFRNVSCG